MKIDGNVRKVAKKPWVLASTLSKIVGAEAPTAPILTGALQYDTLFKNVWVNYLMSKYY